MADDNRSHACFGGACARPDWASSLRPPCLSPLQLLEEYEADPSWAWPGPTRATAIVACLPAFMDASGHSTGGGAPMQRGASLATTQHVDPAAVAGGWRGECAWWCCGSGAMLLCWHLNTPTLPLQYRARCTRRHSAPSATTATLLIAAGPSLFAAMEESGDEDDVPEGAVRFELEAGDIEAALAEDGLEVEAREDVDVRTACDLARSR